MVNSTRYTTTDDFVPKVNRGSLFAALTGKSDIDVSGQGENIRGMLLAIGGRSDRTQSGIDLTAAAEKLGKSRRTVERWVKKAGGGIGTSPTTEHFKDLRLRSRQAATTQAGRRAALKESRDQATSQKKTVNLFGDQGMFRAGIKYMRIIDTETDVTPEQFTAMLNAYEKGGDKGFLKWATNQWEDEYVDGWVFRDISEVEIR